LLFSSCINCVLDLLTFVRHEFLTTPTAVRLEGNEDGCCWRIGICIIRGHVNYLLIEWQGASAAPVHDDNIFVWNATIFGPSETCWEGEHRNPAHASSAYIIQMNLQEEYILCA
jgi:hypothetical protein